MSLGKILGALPLVLLLAIQLVPGERTNPPVEVEIASPPVVAEVLQRSCYACHSHGTVWPWYSRVAPVSWLLINHVEGGRERLNFSAWNRYSELKQAAILREIWTEVAEGSMPLRSYLVFHPEAKLSEGDLANLSLWAGPGPEV